MNLGRFQWLALACLLTACAKPSPIPMVGSPQTPAAEGTVVARVAENGNTSVDIEVKHLAPPDRVLPGAQVYVVWVQPPGGAHQNVGALQVDENLTGRLHTVTPYPAFQVIITPEALPTAASPRGPEVLRASVSQ